MNICIRMLDHLNHETELLRGILIIVFFMNMNNKFIAVFALSNGLNVPEVYLSLDYCLIEIVNIKRRNQYGPFLIEIPFVLFVDNS